jgi:hypothetical protein
MQQMLQVRPHFFSDAPVHHIFPASFPNTLDVNTSTSKCVNTLSHDGTVLLPISAHSVVMIGELGDSHFLQELFVVGDDDELEVRLMLSVLDNLIQGLSKRLDIVAIQICSGFIESNNLRID